MKTVSELPPTLIQASEFLALQFNFQGEIS